MEFKQFLESVEEWDQFVDEKFVGALAGMASDFQCWMRCRDIDCDGYPLPILEQFFQQWMKSKRRGKWCDVFDRKRRKLFSPGRFWADSPSGVYLNKNYVKGWRGVNPVNP